MQEIAGHGTAREAVPWRVGRVCGRRHGHGDAIFQQRLFQRPLRHVGGRHGADLARQRGKAAHRPVALEFAREHGRGAQLGTPLDPVQHRAGVGLRQGSHVDGVALTRHLLPAQQQLLRRQLVAARQQIAERRFVQGIFARLARRQRGHAQPQEVARARQGHIQQAQVFLDARLFHGRHGFVRQRQVDAPLAVVSRILEEAAVAFIHLARRDGERQVHQRVFQPLGLVHGDDLHQLRIAFQAQHALVAALALAGDLLGQPAYQRLFAIELAAGRLQQFGQVQQIRQAPLAARLLQQHGGQLQFVDEAAQHGQHALALPDQVQGLQLLNPAFPFQFVARQPRQLAQRQADGARGKGGARQGAVERVGQRRQPAQHVGRFLAVDDGILVGQIHAGDPAAGQRAADGGRLLAVAHQHGHVGRLQAHEAVRAIEARLRVAQHGDDVLGAVLREILAVAVAAQPFIAGAGGQQGRHGAILRYQAFGAALGVDGLERQRILIAFPVAEGARRHLGPFRMQEQLVDGRHQRRRRAIVGAQLVVAARGGAPRRQVALDVGAAKAVDRLFRVADQE